MTRRRWLQQGAAVAGLTILPSARSAFGYPANEQLNLAVIGIAGYGAYHGFAEVMHRHPGVRWAWSCDVDQRKVGRVVERWRELAGDGPGGVDDPAERRRMADEIYRPLADRPPPLLADARELWDRADQFDAVVIATPDHSHAWLTAAALRAGKPVLVEKPLATSAHEARTLDRLVARAKVPTQVNNHGAAHRPFRRGVELLRQKALGEISEVHVFFGRGGRNFQAPPAGSEPVPPELEWDLWLAQLAERDYHPDWINRIGWRESSLGELGNFGPHSAQMAFTGLDLVRHWRRPDAAPIRIEAECSEVNQLSYPTWEKVRWSFAADDRAGALVLHWHHGPAPDYAPGSRPRLAELLLDHGLPASELEAVLPPAGAGCIMVGQHGLLVTNSHNNTLRLLPDRDFEDVPVDRPQELAVSPGHYHEWIDTCRRGGHGEAPWSRLEVGAPFAELLCLGSLATRFPGTQLEFHPAAGTLSPDAAAVWLKLPYRDGWSI